MKLSLNLHRVNKRDFLLYAAIIIFFVCEWVFDIAIIVTGGLFPYKRFLVIILLLALYALFFFRIRVANIFSIISGLFLIVFVLISSYLSGNIIGGLVYYLPSLLFPIVIFSIVLDSLNSANYHKFLRFVYRIALVQFPFMLIQLVSYDHFPSIIKEAIGPHDFVTGTFFVSGDVTLATLFLGFLMLFLFHPAYSLISSRRWFNIILFSIGIILVNSKLALLLMIILWTIFFLKKLSLLKKIAFVVVVFPLLFFINEQFMGYSERNIDGDIVMRVGRLFTEVARMGNVEANISNEGGINYTRSYAFYQLFIADSFRLFGYGPGAFNNEFPVPLGHVWNNYKDIGVFGLGFTYLYLLSYFVVFRRNMIRNNLIIAVLGLTITIQVLLSPATLLLFALFLRFDELLKNELSQGESLLEPAAIK